MRLGTTEWAELPVATEEYIPFSHVLELEGLVILHWEKEDKMEL
jgi:hypothetical protein